MNDINMNYYFYLGTKPDVLNQCQTWACRMILLNSLQVLAYCTVSDFRGFWPSL